eukprot:5147767-Amphidinium_carterae.1
MGISGTTLTLAQAKYPEIKVTKQPREEIDDFARFTLTKGVEWARKAGCSSIHAIFATGRESKLYQGSRKPLFHNDELSLNDFFQAAALKKDGISFTLTVYTKDANNGLPPTQPIAAWIPEGFMCF